MVSDRAFIFYIYIPWGKPFFSTKVKLICQCQGHSIRKKKKEKNGRFSDIRVSQTDLVSFRKGITLPQTIATFNNLTEKRNFREHCEKMEKYW